MRQERKQTSYSPQVCVRARWTLAQPPLYNWRVLKKPRFLGLKNFLKTPKAEFMFIGFYILCNLLNKPHIKIFNFDL